MLFLLPTVDLSPLWGLDVRGHGISPIHFPPLWGF